MTEKEFNELLLEYKSALELLMARLKTMKLEMETAEERCPIDSMTSRIKCFESVQEKCLRKGYPMTTEGVAKNIRDIVGVRIVTPFRDDIRRVKEAIEARPSTSIAECEDYVATPKANGYSSLHLIVMVEIYFRGRSKMIPIEIQIRDKAMDMWATIEHIVNYKSPESSRNSPEIVKQFKSIADVLYDFGTKAMELRDLSESLVKAAETAQTADKSFLSKIAEKATGKAVGKVMAEKVMVEKVMVEKVAGKATGKAVGEAATEKIATSAKSTAMSAAKSAAKSAATAKIAAVIS